MVHAVIGAKGYGKSTLIAKLVASSHHKNALIYKTPVTVGDAAFKAFRYVPFNKYKGGKVIISAGDVKYLDFLEAVMTKLRDAVVVIDDSAFYERHNLSVQLEQLMNQCRHVDIDVITVYHGLTKFPIQQIPYLNNIVLFHTNDNAAYKANKLPGFEQLQDSINRIAGEVAKGNRYYYEVIKQS
jgi:hypothetical protein